jgi:putative ABC transport system ATP-binding protein
MGFYRPGGLRRRNELSKTEELLHAEGLCRTYLQGSERVQALRDVSFTLAAGEIACIMGRSGTGKSTLLHVLGCLERPDQGKVWLRGRDLGALSDYERVLVRRNELGFLFQSMNLVDYLTARENVALPLRYAGVEHDERMERARVLLEQVGLGKRAHFMPYQLSGGEQQRVALARALVCAPGLVLADEPTGELDTQTSDEIETLMRDLNKSRGTSFLIVTHDESLTRIAHQVWQMRDGQIHALELAGAANQRK